MDERISQPEGTEARPVSLPSQRNLITHLNRLTMQHLRVLVCAISVPLIYVCYVHGLTRNPPGFYLDEAAWAFNAYRIHQAGQGEFGHSWPLYFPNFRLEPPFDYLAYLDPTQIYVQAVLYFIFPPSLLLPRLLSATEIFLAALLLGLLARRISGQSIIGILVALSAILTPWLFEVGRLAFGASLYPLVLVLFLTTLYRAHQKNRWTIIDSALIALTLALVTYTYAIGRLLGPLLALGLLFFAVNRQRFRDVVKTWILYGFALIPILVFHLRHPGALTGRFKMTVGYITPTMSVWEISREFVKHYLENISLRRLLFIGDPILRHHISDTAPFLAGAFVLSIMGVLIVLLRHRKNPWWRFILFGTVISAVPASLTRELFHSLRLVAFPIFLLVLMVPSLMWLVDAWSVKARTLQEAGTSWLVSARGMLRRTALPVLLLLILIQAVAFQVAFRKVGPHRGRWFDDAYPKVFAAALAQTNRPIYLVDQSYLLAYWYAVVQQLNLSNFVYLTGKQRPPEGAVVLSSEDKCSHCELILSDGGFILYKALGSDVAKNSTARPALTTEKFEKPRGIAVDGKGNVYIADSGNARIVKLSAEGKPLLVIGKAGTSEGELGEPGGVAVDSIGNIYVADSARHRLVKFSGEGTFIKEWSGPEPGFYGLRDVAIAKNQWVYLLDQGRARVVRLDPETGKTFEWGRKGAGEGEFNDLTGLTIAGERVYIADAQNDRIQVFDMDGKFIRQWSVPQWSKYIWHRPDVAVDEQSKLIYVTSGWTGEVLVFDMEGNSVSTLKPAPPETFNNVSSLALSSTKRGRQLYVLNTGSDVIQTGPASVSVFDVKEAQTATLNVPAQKPTSK